MCDKSNNVCGSDESDPRFDALVVINAMYPRQLQVDDLEVKNAIETQVSIPLGQNVSFRLVVCKQVEVDITLPDSYPQTFHFHCRVIDGQFGQATQKLLNDRVGIKVQQENVDITDIVRVVCEEWDSIKNELTNRNSTSCENQATNHIDGESSGSTNCISYTPLIHSLTLNVSKSQHTSTESVDNKTHPVPVLLFCSKGNKLKFRNTINHFIKNRYWSFTTFSLYTCVIKLLVCEKFNLH